MREPARSSEVRRVEVTDPVATGRRYDYADAFQVRLPEPDLAAPEAWVRAGMGGTPAVVDWIASLLGHRSEPFPSPDMVEGFRVVRSTSEVVHLEQSLPLMHVVLVGRRVGSSVRELTTLLTYQRPVLARLVWAVVGVGHRLTVRRVITSNVPSAAGNRIGDSERAS